MLRCSLLTVNTCREPHCYQGVILARISALASWMHSSDRASVSSLPSYIFTESHDVEFVLSLKVTLTLPFRYDVLCEMEGWGARSDLLL